MLNEKIYPLVKESILSDRNMKAGKSGKNGIYGAILVPIIQA